MPVCVSPLTVNVQNVESFLVLLVKDKQGMVTQANPKGGEAFKIKVDIGVFKENTMRPTGAGGGRMLHQMQQSDGVVLLVLLALSLLL